MAAAARKTEIDFSLWPSKKEVARILNVSTKTVETMEKEEKLRGATWRRPSGGAPIKVYHPGDVERLCKEREYNPPVMVRTAPPGMPASSPARVDDMAAALVQALERIVGQGGPKLLGAASSEIARPHVEIKDRVYLTVREAAFYLGWPQSQVREAIREGKLLARKEGHTRVRRRDLDKL